MIIKSDNDHDWIIYDNPHSLSYNICKNCSLRIFYFNDGWHSFGTDHLKNKPIPSCEEVKMDEALK